MEFYDSSTVNELSVRDVFENEVQSEMDKLLRSDSARFSPQPDLAVQTTLDSTGFADLGSMTWTFQDQGVQTSTTDIIPTSEMTTSTHTSVDFNQISSVDGVDNQIQNLLVDPQTGLPVSTALHIDPNSAQASLQMIVNSLPELQAQLAVTSVESLGLANVGSIFTPSPTVLSLNTQQTQQVQPQSPVILSQTPNQNLTFQNGTIQTSDLQQQITLSNFNELAAQTLLTQLQNQQQQLHVANGNVQNGPIAGLNSPVKPVKTEPQPASPKKSKSIDEKVYPKPAYSYSCLITMALKNSQTGCLPVSEIYHFMCENFPYFKTAPDGWKNSVRHNLSLNKCFAKIEKPTPTNGAGTTRKGCLWALNPEKQAKMEEEVCKWTKKDPLGIKRSMAKPEEFDKIEALSRCSSSPKPSPTATTPPLSTVPPPLQSIISTATTTTVTTAVDTKSEDSQGVFTEHFFNTSLNMLDPTLTQLDGDLGLQDNLLDTFNDISNLDMTPITTSPLPGINLTGSILDTSPFKDSTQTFMSFEAPQTHSATTALQFCSPTRTPQVTAFM